MTWRHDRSKPARRAMIWLGAGVAGVLLWVFGMGTAARSQDVTQPPPQRVAMQLTLDGAIGPASADYVVRGLSQAARQRVAVVVLRIDTPGGLDTSMREIIRAILASPVPVLGYVSPSGARAASAGTYILYASHISAMAPGTNLGAATPIAIGGLPDRMPGDRDDKSDKGTDKDEGAKQPTAPKTTSEAKAINDAVAYIRALAALHGRDADWAEQAVREAASLSANEAQARKVIDLIATSVPDLLDKAHGRSVRLGEGHMTLDTRNLRVEPVDPDLRARVLGVITNPNLAVILMMIGVYGLIFEFMTPGSLYPGTIGAICLLLGLYALSALPLDYAGLALLVLGISLLVAETFTPSAGVLGIGGVVAFVLGAGMLIDTESPAFAVSRPIIAGVALVGLGLTLLVAKLAAKSRRVRVVSGPQALVGQHARVLDWHGSTGYVLADGERWQATGSADLHPDQIVTITAAKSVHLWVSADPASRHGHKD